MSLFKNEKIRTPVVEDSTGVQAAAITLSATALPAAAPAGGTGAAEGAWDTAANRDAAITTINGLRTIVNELRGNVSSLITACQNAGITK